MDRSEKLHDILLVEDDPHIREVAALALEQSGDMSVEECGRGADAPEMAADSKPDLVLLDVMMPEVDGVEVLARLRDSPKTSPIPVVFLTARAQPSEIEEYRDLGVLDVIVKPFDPVELPERVREAWTKR